MSDDSMMQILMFRANLNKYTSNAIKTAFVESVGRPKGIKNAAFGSVCLIARILIRDNSLTSKESKTENHF